MPVIGTRSFISAWALAGPYKGFSVRGEGPN